jgi:hypothetical protein
LEEEGVGGDAWDYYDEEDNNNDIDIIKSKK